MDEMQANDEINRAVLGYCNADDPENLYPDWQELFTKHKLVLLGEVGELRYPDGITWLPTKTTEYKQMPVISKAVVQYREDGSYMKKLSGLLG